MTTIASVGMQIAADSQCTVGSMVSGYVDKLVETDHGIVGISGPSIAERPFLEFLETGKKPDNADDIGGFNGLVLRPGGTVELYCSFEMVQTTDPDFPVAIGSGAEIAVGAMMAGKTADEAVAVACERDCYSGGKISVFSVEDEGE